MTQHFKHISIALIILTIAFQSCKSDKSTNSNNSLFGNLPTQLVDTLKQIGQLIQVREIDPTKDNIIIGDSGTKILISANSIVNAQGKTISDKVKIELKENYTFADFVTSNLQTISNDELLQTQGMIYFNATSGNDLNLKIDKDKPIRIEFPVRDIVAGAKIFKGQRDKNGNINWDTAADPIKSLIPFPIRTLAPQFFGECPKDFGITKDRKYYNEHKGDIYLTFDTISKYENTLLATREFKERFYSYCMPDLTKIYIANLDKNLWEIDEMMVQYFIRDSTERVNLSINNKPTPFFKGQTVTRKEQWQAYQWLIDHDKEYGHNMIEFFKIFAALKLTKIDQTKKIDTSVIKETTTAFVAYDALEFGWVNVDYFYKDPKAEKTKLIAKTNKEAFIINLILPNKKIILTGIQKSDNTYWFTKQEDGYNKLPKGEKAFIICMSITDNKLYFAEKEIIIGQSEIETLNLMETNGETVKAKLKNYGR
jgi:hypothetical protein